MKKILLVLGLVVSSLISTAQVEQCDIVGRYTENYEWSESEGRYLTTSTGWNDISFTIRDDFYIVTIEGMDSYKIWWNFDPVLTEKSKEPCEVYFTKDGRKVIFRYEHQDIVFFSDWSDELGRYTGCTIISKTSKVTGSEYKGTKQQEPNSRKRPF